MWASSVEEQRGKRCTAAHREARNSREESDGIETAGAAGAGSSDITSGPKSSAAQQAPPAANGAAHSADLSANAKGIEGEDSLARFLMACAYIRYGGITKQLGPGVSIGVESMCVCLRRCLCSCR